MPDRGAHRSSGSPDGAGRSIPGLLFSGLAARVPPRLKRRLLRAFWSHRPFPDWVAIIGDRPRWNRLREAAKAGPRVLIATGTGGHQYVTPIEGMLAVALTLRGADVHFLLCDRFLPACLQAMSMEYPDVGAFAREGPQSLLCGHCYTAGKSSYDRIGLTVHNYSSWVSREERASADELSKSIGLGRIGEFRLDGIAVGEHALAGALRFFAVGDLQHEPHGEAVLRRYLHASLLTAYAARSLMRLHEYDVAVFHHGIYVPQGLVGEVCRQQGARVVNWVPSYRKKCFTFSHGDTYHHTLMTEPTSEWEDMPWGPATEAVTLEYLKSRWQGTNDWIHFLYRPETDVHSIARELGIDFSRPTIGMLTNVLWDAQLHYPANAFPDMLDWLLQTIQYFRGREDLQLLVRVHPAEIRGSVPSRQPVVAEIKKAFQVLPPNVFIIPPESAISTYAAMVQCDSVLIYGTKTGVELASQGIPVVVAGEAWIRNKGITIDAKSSDEYFRILDTLPLRRRMDEAGRLRARKYAFHFFFRRMIPLSFVEPQKGWWPYRLSLSGLDDLMPGRDPGLDVICEAVLTGSPFVYPAEHLC